MNWETMFALAATFGIGLGLRWWVEEWMRTRRRTVIALVTIFLYGVLCAVALGQTATITGPAKAAAGWPVVFDTTGSDGTLYEWTVVPATAQRGLVPVDNGRRMVFAAPHNGKYVIFLTVDRQAFAGHRLTLEAGITPQPPPDPPAPPEDLLGYVRRLTADVQATAAEPAEVSDLFFRLAGRISSGELRGSQAIVTATTEAFHGEARDLRTNWATWYAALMGHLLDDLKLVSQQQWADAYQTISEGVKR